ncbi:hypothetical protein [Paragemmobacter straminiformis]|uniref:Uncharacterized protein n=1 Tax=Paragemmobacter straminiformis TaxID=2045119 RepID=A0A842I3E8_9RHOB|nr:hypothetical protein [Gemmobacter straminiformis]MBC2834692.1 hypothetical protein [Gemmobacter straminiformis]
MTSVAYSKPKPNQFDIRYRMGQGYAVFGPDGRQVSPWSPSSEYVENLRSTKQREADARKKRGTRSCMCCGNKFMSDGIHNRLCGRCNGRGHQPS